MSEPQLYTVVLTVLVGKIRFSEIFQCFQSILSLNCNPSANFLHPTQTLPQDVCVCVTGLTFPHYLADPLISITTAV